MNNPAFRLGQRVYFTGTVEKRRSGLHVVKTEFVEAPLPTITDALRSRQVSEGVVVGYRTVMEGETRYDYEDGASFRAKLGSGRRVWLIAFDLRRKPVMAFDHQVSEDRTALE